MKKAIQFVLYAVMVLYIPCLLAISALSDQSGAFFEFPFLLLFVLLLLISIRYACAFFELGFIILRSFDKKERTLGEKILNVLSAISPVGLLVTIFFEPDFGITNIVLSVLLIILWILGDVIFKQKKFSPELFKKKYFWIALTSFLVAFCIVLAITEGRIKDKSRPDPLDPSIEEIEDIEVIE